MKLEAELEAMRQEAEDYPGIWEPPMRHAILMKAFRLKYFGRCPRCDQKPITIMDDVLHWGWRVVCQVCQWETLIAYRAVEFEEDGYVLVAEMATG